MNCGCRVMFIVICLVIDADLELVANFGGFWLLWLLYCDFVAWVFFMLHWLLDLAVVLWCCKVCVLFAVLFVCDWIGRFDCVFVSGLWLCL